MVAPQVKDEFEVGASKMWHDDPYAGGAFALFEPSQQTLLYSHIIAPEGRIHFAGEHASLHHAWIQGAIESGLRTALEINALGGQELYTKEEFSAQGISLQFLRCVPVPYPQPPAQGFMANLSMIDVMMHNSREQLAQQLNSVEVV